jgi:hypothetical protein
MCHLGGPFYRADHLATRTLSNWNAGAGSSAMYFCGLGVEGARLPCPARLACRPVGIHDLYHGCLTRDGIPSRVSQLRVLPAALLHVMGDRSCVSWQGRPGVVANVANAFNCWPLESLACWEILVERVTTCGTSLSNTCVRAGCEKMGIVES